MWYESPSLSSWNGLTFYCWTALIFGGLYACAHLKVGPCPLGKGGFAHLVGLCPLLMQIRLKDDFLLDRAGFGWIAWNFVGGVGVCPSITWLVGCFAPMAQSWDVMTISRLPSQDWAIGAKRPPCHSLGLADLNPPNQVWLDLASTLLR